MSRGRIASGTVVVLVVAAVLLMIGVALIVANWGNTPVVVSIVAVLTIGGMAMANGARTAARHDRATQQR